MEPGGAGSTGIYVTTNRLSLLVVARDEERQLEDCLTSGTFADEIIVVLDRSTDASATIAARLGAKIIDGSWVDEGERRMTGISQCGGDWILELDADERISAELAAEVATQIQSDDADYYVIPFRNYIKKALSLGHSRLFFCCKTSFFLCLFFYLCSFSYKAIQS